MANITFGKALKDWGYLEDFYDMKTLKLVSKTATKAVFRDGNGDQIVLTGTGMSFKGNIATKGTVTGADFIAGSGSKYLTFTKGDFAAKELFTEILKNKDFYGLLSDLTAGDDVIKGLGNHEDIIIGDNAGDDRMFGNGGDDFFNGSLGKDFMDGGKGWDTLSYEWDDIDAKNGIVLNVTKGTVKDGRGDADTIKNFEEYRGSRFADKILGSAKDENFMGLAGKDTIDGGEVTTNSVTIATSGLTARKASSSTWKRARSKMASATSIRSRISRPFSALSLMTNSRATRKTTSSGASAARIPSMAARVLTRSISIGGRILARRVRLLTYANQPTTS